MFKFITKRYEEKIYLLENRIEIMNYEWSKERELYTKKTKKRYYEQKVDFVIGGLDMTQHTDIHRPMYGLTDNDAFIIAGMVKDELFKQGFISATSFHWRDKDECYVIDVEVLPDVKLLPMKI